MMEDEQFLRGVAQHIAEALRARQYGDDAVYEVWHGGGTTVLVRHADRTPYSIAVITVMAP